MGAFGADGAIEAGGGGGGARAHCAPPLGCAPGLAWLVLCQLPKRTRRK